MLNCINAFKKSVTAEIFFTVC